MAIGELVRHNHLVYGISASNRTAPARLNLQEDGNFVLYNASGALWSTQTNSSGSGYRITEIGSDGWSEYIGDNQAHNTLQPYLSIYMYRRVT